MLLVLQCMKVKLLWLWSWNMPAVENCSTILTPSHHSTAVIILGLPVDWTNPKQDSCFVSWCQLSSICMRYTYHSAKYTATTWITTTNLLYSFRTPYHPFCVMTYQTTTSGRLFYDIRDFTLNRCRLFEYFFKIQFCYFRCCGCPWNRGRQLL